MALTNSQYNEIMRIYNAREQEAIRIRDQRQEEVYAEIPELADLDSQKSALFFRKARSAVMAKADDDFDYKTAFANISKKRKRLLRMHGYTEEWLEPPYTCPNCKDTGYDKDNKKCQCFRQMEIELLTSQAHMEDISDCMGFTDFSVEYYPKKKPKAKGLSPYEEAQNALDKALDFVDTFGCGRYGMLFYGNVGVGKTFLSRCIARELLEKQYSVLYLSAQRLFSYLETYEFKDRAGVQELRDLIFESDLLIIDDLGTEMPNSFTASQLFLIVNERILSRKQTIISTNLDLPELTKIYSDRIFSRLYENYDFVHMSGKDIRVLKSEPADRRNMD